MANLDKKASQLDPPAAITEDDYWAGVQGGTDKKFTPALMRSLLGVPRAVANLTAAASLVAIVAAGGAVRVNRSATLTLSSTAHRLTQPVDGTLDLNGSKLLFGYTDTSNSTNFNAVDVLNGTVEIAAGCNIHRLFRFQQDGGRLDDVTVQSVNFIINSNDTNDAAIRVEGDFFSSSNLTLKNMRIGCMVLGQNAYFENLQAYGMTKALVGNGGSAVVDVFTFDGTGSVSTTDPGHNAIGGNWKYLSVNKFRITFMGEHGIYVAGDGKNANQEVSFTGGYIARTGQCSFKAKDYSRVHAFDINAVYSSYGNTPGINEEGFRFQRNGLVTGGALNITRELVNGVPTGNAGWAHMFFSGNDVVELLTESYAEGSGRGIHIGVDDSDASIPHGRITVRVRHKNLGGPSVEVADGAIINDVITIYADIDGCPGAPVTIGTGVTFGPNGKIRVIGTYRGCGAPPPASTANVDLSGLRSADNLIPNVDRRISPWVAAATLTIAASNLPEISEFGNQGGTIASFTAVLPVGKDGQKVNLRTRAAVTALTVTASGGAAVYGAPGSFAAGGHATLEFVASENAWFRAE